MAAPAPTTQEVYDASRLPWTRLKVASPDDLAEPLAVAVAYVETVTGRYFDTDAPPQALADAPLPLDSTPSLVPLARRAVRMRVEQVVKQDQPGYIDTVTDDAIQSFSAGPYSETRRDPTRRGETRLVNEWLALNDLLWLLMTPTMFDYWQNRLSGVHAPDFSVEEVEWGLVGTPLSKRLSGGGVFDPTAPWTMWQ